MSKKLRKNFNSSIVTSGGDVAKSRAYVPKRFLIAVLVIVVIGCAGAGYWFVLGNGTKNQPDSSEQEKGANGQFSRELNEAQQKVEANAGGDKEKLGKSYAELGQAYLNKGQPDAALDSFKKSLEASPAVKREAMVGIAYSYADSGQTNKAVEQFKKLIDYLKTVNDPYAESAIQGYENDIKQLESGGEL